MLPDHQDAPAGIDASAVTAWLTDAVDTAGGEPVNGPLTFSQIMGGRSNLTFRVSDQSGTSWALRRPPTGNVLATAHDMVREHRVMSALATTDVPVPAMIGLCTDDSINGADFYVMEWVDGHVVRDRSAAGEFSEQIQRKMGLSVVENLAHIHAVDIDAVGLGDFAKRSGYVERQLRRWKRQIDSADSPVGSVVIETHDELLSRLPADTPARIVHGDYRLDNTIVNDNGVVLAVLDWELTTLGDPLADLGALLCYWSRPGDAVVALTDPPTLAPGFIERDEVIAAYESATGPLTGDVNYYHSFATWRLACILHGVVDRYRAGAMGDDDGFDPDSWAGQVTELAENAREILRGSAD